MPQDPFKVDQIQIEPGSGDTLVIGRDASTGSLKFVDAVETGGLLLSQLAGLQTISGVKVVGRGGSGAQYTSIQEALNDTVSASSESPSIILILPGVYTENVVIEKDGVCLVALGRVTLRPLVVSDPTVIIREGSETPSFVFLHGLRVEHPEDGGKCLDIQGGAGSTVGAEEILVQSCDLVASGVGGFTLSASTVDYVRVCGGTWAGSSSTALCSVANCAGFLLEGVGEVRDLQLAYDTGASRPSETASEYRVAWCSKIGSSIHNLVGEGSILYAYCPSVGDITIGGDRSITLVGCRVGDMALNGTVSCVRVGGSRGSVSGSGTLSESILTGTATFDNATSQAVSFPVPGPDADYVVHVDWDDPSVVVVPASKTPSGFTLQASGPYTGTVAYSVLRDA